MTTLIADKEAWPEVVATKDVSAWAVMDLAFSGSGSSVSTVKCTRCGKRYLAIASSISFFGLTMSSERRQLATTFARPRSWRQSSIASRARVRRTSFGVRERDAVVRRMVHANNVFLAQGSAVSDSRRWACERMERKRLRQPRVKSRVLDVGCFGAGGMRPWRKRLKIGKA